VNALTDEEGEQLAVQSEIVSQQPTDAEPAIERPTEEIESQPEAENTETVETAEVEVEAEAEEITPEIVEAAPEETGELRTRSGREVRRPTRFIAVTKVSRSEWGETSCQVAIKLELRQLFDDLKALRVVRRASISRSTKVLQSHMFLVRKYLADGAFDKVKARLVADGRDQDPAMYPNRSSPTVAIHSVFATLGIASTKRWRVIVKIDVKGAFVQTPMTGEPTYVRIDPKVTRVAVELYPRLAEYVESDGCLYTLLLKALYGCVQASALWYALIKSVLIGMGYEVGPTDPCVFVKQVGDRIFILLLYVDDILAIVDKAEAERIRVTLVARFGTVQFEIGGKLSYLGMEIDIRDTGTVIDMSFYVKQVVADAETRYVVTTYESPGVRTSYVVEDDAEKLPEDRRAWFHSVVAKLLYIAKRARPDVLTVVIFLCTRVQGATTEDEKKLLRVLGYLKLTSGRTLMLRATDEKSKVVAYMDAAYALHSDSKSHSGVIIYVGGTLCYVSSRKQKCMSKSPTEAELIALTDNLGLVELFQEFVEFITRKKVSVPVVFQDCNAVVSLVTLGGGKLRTKHLRARMNLGKEMVDEKRVLVQYKTEKDMVADGFSKPYDPVKHRVFMERILQGDELYRGQQVGAGQNREQSA
jgi:hypothetical protein